MNPPSLNSETLQSEHHRNPKLPEYRASRCLWTVPGIPHLAAGVPGVGVKSDIRALEFYKKLVTHDGLVYGVLVSTCWGSGSNARAYELKTG